MKFLKEFLDNSSAKLVTFLSFLILIIISLVDHLLSYEISFSVFYLLPIALTTWSGIKYSGAIFSVIAAVFWLIADKHTGHIYSSASIIYWNALVRLIFFFIVNRLLLFIRNLLKEEEIMADIDSLTGVFNSRAFYERLEIELERAKRYKRPFSLAYMDLDNFKTLNDTHGHTAGDEFLQNFSFLLKKNIRQIDFVGRLGGDEFIVFFPETNYQGANSVLNKIKNILLEKMDNKGVQITTSIGAITYKTVLTNSKEMIADVDKLMYSVKKNGKNGIVHLEQ